MSIESRIRQYGTVFDHYQIRESLGKGSGGKSQVFLLKRKDSDFGDCALKIISLIDDKGKKEELSPNRRLEYDQAKQKCKRIAENEVMLMESISGNTNIVDYKDHDFVEWEDGDSFGCDMLIRMELLTVLRSKMNPSHSFFEENEIIKIGKHICTALELCHKKGILHRDIKPENIFINRDGNYKLGDFGISKILDNSVSRMTSTGICTREYAPAEQISGDYDMRVDIYSLGLVLYELANENRLPFAKSTYATPDAVQRRLIGKEIIPAPTGVSTELANVILKACAHKPHNRYQTAEEFYQALDDLEQSPTASVHCPLCNEENPYNSIVCKNCGYVFSGESNDHVVCFVCGNKELAQKQLCSKCGSPLHEKPNPKLKCSKCGAPLEENQQYCLICLTPVNPGDMKFCVHCGAEMSKEQQVCRSCGKKQNNSVEIPKVLWLVFAAIVVVFLGLFALFGRECEHDWAEATCSEPKTCVLCQETTGEPIDHDWAEATCSEPKTCVVCRETIGEPKEHVWELATYTQPQTCSVCGATEGTKLEVQPRYITELVPLRHIGKIWTRGDKAPSGGYDTMVEPNWGDFAIQGYTGDPVKDVKGQEYHCGLHVDGDQAETYSVTYAIDGRYTVFTGIYGCPAETIAVSRKWIFGHDYEKYFEVYGDNKLLFTSDVIKSTYTSRSFEIDVSGVNELTISYPASMGPNEIATIFDGKFI